MATNIKNPGQYPVTLPYPFRCILGPGESKTSPLPPSAVLGYLGITPGVSNPFNSLAISEIKSTSFNDVVMDISLTPASCATFADLNSLISGDPTMPDTATESINNRAWRDRSIGSSGESAFLLNGLAEGAGARNVAYQKAFTVPDGVTSVTQIARLSTSTTNTTVTIAFYDSGQNTIIASAKCALTTTPQTFILPLAVVPGTTYYAGIVVNDLGQEARPYLWAWSVTPNVTASGVFSADFYRIFLHDGVFGGTSLPMSWALSFLAPLHSHMADVTLLTDASQLAVECYSNDSFVNVTYPHRVGLLTDRRPYGLIGDYPIGLRTLGGLLPSDGRMRQVIVRAPPISLGTSWNGHAGCWMRSIYVPANSRTRIVDQTTHRRLVVVGDSIAGGTQPSVAQNAAVNPHFTSWPAVLRNRYPGSVIVESWGGRQLFDDQAAIAAAARRVCAALPTDIWIALGTNDYFNAQWSAASFGTAYGTYLDTCHAYSPQASVFCQTPLLRTAPAVETANAQGSTTANYRTQITTQVSTRTPWAIAVDGTGGFWPQVMGTDGIHPDANGQGKIYDEVVRAMATVGIM